MKYLKYLIFIFILTFTPKAFALDVDVTNTITSPNSSTQGRYSGTEIYNTGTDNVYSVKTRYNGKLSRIRFNLPLPSTLGQCFSTNVSYTVTLNMATSDWRNKFGEVSASAYNHNFALGGVPTFVSMKKIYFNVKLPTSVDYCVDYLFVDIQSTNISTTAFTGESNWQLQSVILTDPTYNNGGSGGGSSTPTPTPYIDLSPIVDSQNQNTEDIISNQNSNTSNIIENINDNSSHIIDGLGEVGQQVLQSSTNIINYYQSVFENCRTSVNLVNTNLTSQTLNGINISNDTKGQLTFNGTSNDVISKQISSYINFPAAGSYYFSLSKTGSFSGGNVIVILYGRNGVSATALNVFSISSINGTSFNLDNSYEYYYLWLYVPNGVTFNNFSISPQIEQGSSFTQFEPFGLYCTNRLDEQTQAINNIDNYLKDNSDPYIADNDFLSMFNSIGFNDPLQYLLQLPVQFINTLVSQSNSCQIVNLGTLWGVSITFPCINLQSILGSGVWSTIDILMSIGLLVVIIKNLYETFANLLTMGGEKQAREKFNMPTPMEFLSMILGGDR